MKIVYEADDGTEFDTEKECLAYEKRSELDRHIAQNCQGTYSEDAGFNVIEVDDIAEYIRTYSGYLATLVKAERKNK